jgi:hypothetical protein
MRFRPVHCSAMFRAGWQLAVWDVSAGLQLPGQANAQPANAGSSDRLAGIRMSR